MDFHSTLSAAKQNISLSKNKQNYYSTSFAPPKKETREKRLSNNIKKFLEKQKEDEEEKARLAREKKLELLARRDPKLQRKIEKSLKVIKSSKKYYTGDKTLDENTAVTLEGEHPDEDDYGFASSTSDVYYQKLMEKYQKLPVEDKMKRIFPKKGKAAAAAATSTTTTQNGEIHIKNGHRERVSTIKGQSSSSSSSKSNDNKKSSADIDTKPKPKLKAAPPVDFHALLKLAEKKQHEEIMIAVPTKKEPERLLTSKEKREMEELEAAKKAKLKPQAVASSTIAKIPKLGAIPKLNDKNNNTTNKSPPSATATAVDRSKIKTSMNPPLSSNSKLRDALSRPESKPASTPSSLKATPSTSKSSTTANNIKSRDNPSKISSLNGVKNPLSRNDKPSTSTSTSKEVVKTREFPPKDLQKTREFPPRDLQKTREFPPRDLKRPRELAMRDMKRSKMQQQQQMMKKRRIVDDDDDSEYDSEMDDFIDDEDEDVDVSNAIKSIFGYDKSRYRDEDFDDREMESDYRTVMKEELISKKIGLMEDLEDMRREQEELERKAMKKKKVVKR